MKIQIKISRIVIILTCIFSTSIFANENPLLPPVQTQGQTRFISGGIGKDESNAILQARGSWPLMLQLAQTVDSRAHYISDAQITIKNELRNTVLDTATEGPYLLVNLPAGEYSLEATYNGITLHRKLNLQNGSNNKITLIWPADKKN